MNKDDVAGLVERLQKHIFYGDARLFNMQQHSPLAMEAADALTTLSAENEALKHDVQRQMAIAYEHVNENAALSARVERLEAACQQYLDAFDAGTGTVYVEPVIRQALAGDTNHG